MCDESHYTGRVIIKRDGREVPFNETNIYDAIVKAFNEVDGTATLEDKQLALNIADDISSNTDGTLTVEEIQDMVEVRLMQSDRKDVAKAYILYRNERTKIRERNSNIVQKIMVRANSEVDDRSNANVDEKSFSGREKEASSDIGKIIALDYDGLSPEVANAHKEMRIYQHDLEKAIYGVHNCLNLNFQEIFTNGFRTRNGDVRPPKNFSTACQLVAVAFQCQSQVQFGGVGSIHIDYDLAPFVTMSYKRYFKDALKWLYEMRDDDINLICDKYDVTLGNEELSSDYPLARKYAMSMLEREGKQSAEALYHNLNTLESRQGSQVPFTSINLGRDTSPEGRMVSKDLLNASIAGIGAYHKTSIFPISIFQYKQGVNANPGDPNYDLKQLALKSMSKRIYPNWCNDDWSQAHEDPNNPDTFFSTMGKWKYAAHVKSFEPLPRVCA